MEEKKMSKNKKNTKGEQAPESDLQSAHEWRNKAIILDAGGSHKEAIICYDKAINLDPHEASIWYYRGKSLHSLGRYEEALGCFDEAEGLAGSMRTSGPAKAMPSLP